MMLIESILKFGVFEIPLSEIRTSKNFLSVEEAEDILAHDNPLLTRIFLQYVRSFSHHHEFRKDSSPNSITLRIAPSRWLPRFLLGGAGFVLGTAILVLLLGSQDRETAVILNKVLMIVPVVIFGIPSILGWLYFRHCAEKLRRYAE